jgi:excisionase family DNA binding protein
METNPHDGEIAVPRTRDGRLRPGHRMSIDTTGEAQDESIDGKGQFTAEQGGGQLLAVEKRQAAASSFEPLIDSAAAAVLLKVHRKTLERLALRGEVPGHKVGKFWRFRASELDEWLRSGVNSGRQPCCTTTF